MKIEQTKMLYCKRCNKDKNISEFNTNQKYCKECHREYMKEYRKIEHKPKIFLPEGKRYCKRCDTIKNSDEFNIKQIYCKICMKKINQENYRKNKDHVLHQHKIYIKNNLEKVRKKQNIRNRRWVKKSIEELNDRYIKNILLKQGFTKDMINPEIIELKRILIKIKRL